VNAKGKLNKCALKYDLAELFKNPPEFDEPPVNF